MSAVDSRAPPKKWGVFTVQDVADGWLRREVAINRLSGGGGRGEAEKALVEALKRLQAWEETITARALAREAGVHHTTASRWLQRMRGQG